MASQLDVAVQRQISLGRSMWSELPEDLVGRIMEFLPLEGCYRFRSVCRMWKDVLSSNYFLTARGKPGLILCMPNTQMSFLLYSFTTRTWRTVSLSFLPDVSGVNFRGSAAGLLLVDIPTYSFLGNAFLRVCVCNPFTRTTLTLPEMQCVTQIMAKGIVGGDNESYKVVVVGKSRSKSGVVAEVYSFSTKSWKIAGILPDSLVIRNEDMLFCRGFFFCMTANDGIVACNIGDGINSIGVLIPMPLQGKTNYRMWPRLVACESRIVMVGAMENGAQVLKDVIIWELIHPQHQPEDEKNAGFWWREVGRMPRPLCQDFRRSSTWFECVGVGDKMCFRAHGSLDVLVFCVAQGSWYWLPKCPATHAHCKHMRLRSLCFEAKPDTKV